MATMAIYRLAFSLLAGLCTSASPLIAQAACSRSISQPAQLSASITGRLVSVANENGAVNVNVARRNFYPAISAELLTAFLQDYVDCVNQHHPDAEDAVLRLNGRVSTALSELEYILAEDKTSAERVRAVLDLRTADLDELRSSQDEFVVVRQRLNPPAPGAAGRLFTPPAAGGVGFEGTVSAAGTNVCLQVGPQAIQNATLADINAVRATYNALNQYLRGNAREDTAMQQVMMSVYAAMSRAVGQPLPPIATTPACRGQIGTSPAPATPGGGR